MNGRGMRFLSSVVSVVLVAVLAWGPMRDPGMIMPSDGQPIVYGAGEQVAAPTMQDAGPTRY